MKKLLFALVASMFLVPAKAQVAAHSRITTVNEMLAADQPDTLAIRQYLEEWEKQGPKNADLCTAWFNYYMLPIQADASVGDGIQIRDSLGNIAGSIRPFTGEFPWDHGKSLKLAVAKLEEGLKISPSRLDIWMGKTKAFMMVGEYVQASENIYATLRESKKNNNVWTWKEDEPMNEEGIQAIFSQSDYAIDMMESGQIDLAHQVMDSLIAYYPEHSMFKLIKAELYARKRMDNEALSIMEPLFEEYKGDMFYVSNLAWIYSDNNQLDKMEECCAILDASGDSEMVNFASSLRMQHMSLNIDFEEIRAFAQSNPDELQRLTDRFIKADESLSLDEICKVYFGHAADPKNCVMLWEGTDAERQLFDAGKYKETLEMCEKALEKHPASLAANTFAFLALRQLDEQDPRLGVFYTRFSMIVTMIEKGGKPLVEDEPEKSLVYSILWRDDENTLVDVFFRQQEELRRRSYLFTNPVYFLQALNENAVAANMSLKAPISSLTIEHGEHMSAFTAVYVQEYKLDTSSKKTSLRTEFAKEVNVSDLKVFHSSGKEMSLPLGPHTLGNEAYEGIPEVIDAKLVGKELEKLKKKAFSPDREAVEKLKALDHFIFCLCLKVRYDNDVEVRLSPVTAVDTAPWCLRIPGQPDIYVKDEDAVSFLRTIGWTRDLWRTPLDD